MGFVAILGMFVLVTFLVTVITRRAYQTTALVIGSVPAAIIVVESLPALLNPLSWFVILPVWIVGVVGALTGAWLARLVHAHWRRA